MYRARAWSSLRFCALLCWPGSLIVPAGTAPAAAQVETGLRRHHDHCVGLSGCVRRLGTSREKMVLAGKPIKLRQQRLISTEVCLKMIPAASWHGFGPGTFILTFPHYTNLLAMPSRESGNMPTMITCRQSSSGDGWGHCHGHPISRRNL